MDQKKIAALLMATVYCLLSAAVMAEEPKTEDPAKKEDYWTLSGRKLGRGAYNTALGWTELPGGIQSAGAKHGVGAAATWGVLNGLGRAFQRTAVGVFELVTFPVGVPRDFKPIMQDDLGDQNHHQEEKNSIASGG